MDRFTGKCLRLSAILFGIGAVFSCIGLAGGATKYSASIYYTKESDNETVTSATVVSESLMSDEVIVNNEEETSDLGTVYKETAVQSDETESSAVSNGKNDSLNITYSHDDIEKLDFEFAVSTVRIAAGDSLSVEANNIDSNFKTYIKGNTWHIKDSSSGINFNSYKYNQDIVSNVVITIPDGRYFYDVKIDVQAGTINIGEIKAEDLQLDVSAGTMEIDTLEAGKLELNCGAGRAAIYNAIKVNDIELECGMGSIDFKGAIEGHGDIDCSMGNINMDLGVDKYLYYNYNIECGMGRISLYQDVYSGLSSEKKIDNDADYTLDIECGMGNINIR